MKKQKRSKITHLHWKKLINHPKVIRLLNDHEVYQITILPCSPPEPDHDYEAHFYLYNKLAGGQVKHKLDCTWEEV
jgi:hypothetical protein